MVFDWNYSTRRPCLRLNKNQDGRKAKKLKNSFQPTFWKFGESLSAEADSADFHLEGLPGLANVLHLDVHDRQPGERVNVRAMLVSDISCLAFLSHLVGFEVSTVKMDLAHALDRSLHPSSTT